ncbi:MAG: phenylacetate--CoA ligase family protein [Candidatus Cloacimonetes bacterium]|nr:phenylacetate--CoA ligase family protein [Candidatus Cloacimonadota bacterium]
MTSKLEIFYQKTPLWMQNLAANVKGRLVACRRYSRDFYVALKELQSHESLTAFELEQLSISRLKSALAFALANSDFYRQRFHGFGLQHEDWFEQFVNLPLLDKMQIREASLIDGPLPGEWKVATTHTSGTTGQGLVFPCTQKQEQYTWATWWRYRIRHGLSLNERCAVFGGRSVVPLSQHKPPYWRYSNATHQVFYSMYHLNCETVIDYLEHLQREKIRWIHGYPSVLAILAGLLLDKGIKVSGVQWITTGAESLLEHQNDIISKAFGTFPIDHYGQAEGVANISMCKNRRYHIDEDYSFVELVPVMGRAGIFEIVGTNFYNNAYPLIRYRTGDLVKVGPPCDCGLAGRVVEDIDGRKEEGIRLSNGTILSRLDHIFKDMTRVLEAQIIQRSDLSIQLRIVKANDYTSEDEYKLLSEVKMRIHLPVHIKYVAKLPRSSTGKLRFVIHEEF